MPRSQRQLDTLVTRCKHFVVKHWKLTTKRSLLDGDVRLKHDADTVGFARKCRLYTGVVTIIRIVWLTSGAKLINYIFFSVALAIVKNPLHALLAGQWRNIDILHFISEMIIFHYYYIYCSFPVHFLFFLEMKE